MGILSTVKFVSSTLGLTNLLAGAGVAAALGFAAAETYEHTVPWGLGPQKERLLKSIASREAEAFKKGAQAQFRLDEGEFRKWDLALQACNTTRSAESQEHARQTTELKSSSTISRTTAYRLGRASCGVPNATPPTGISPSAGSVRNDEELRTILGPAAYRPRRPG
jgi:hypothetical protein